MAKTVSGQPLQSQAEPPPSATDCSVPSALLSAADAGIASGNPSDHDDTEPHLRVAVHDRSRLEWVATVPLAPRGKSRTWEIVLEADVADAIWVPHQPWDHFQVRTRLTSPLLQPGRRQAGPAIDQLRRRGLAAVHELKLATRLPMRILEQARRRDRTLTEAEADSVIVALHQAVQRAQTARVSWDYLVDAGSESLVTEQRLVDEFLSCQILMLITRLTQAMRGREMVGRAAKPLKSIDGSVARLDAALADAILEEQAYRRRVGVSAYRIRGPHDVEVYLNRAAALKKHFQQALFLDAHAYMLDARLRNWIAVMVAMVASTFYFAGQIWVLNAAMSTAQTTVSLAIACLIAALVYAAKDRIKEVGRDWVVRRVKNSYANRIANLHLQARMDPEQTKLATARETITVTKRLEPDVLNPDLGRTAAVHQIIVREHLKHSGLKVLHDQGLTGLKHVFRYDLSPLFDKLDDQAKQVPVLTSEGVRTMAAARVYSLSLRVTLREVGGTTLITETGELLLRRRGLIRFVRGNTAKAKQAEAKAVERTPLPLRARFALPT